METERGFSPVPEFFLWIMIYPGVYSDTRFETGDTCRRATIVFASVHQRVVNRVFKNIIA